MRILPLAISQLPLQKTVPAQQRPSTSSPGTSETGDNHKTQICNRRCSLMSSPSLQGQWGSSTTFLFYVQPFQHKQQQQQCQRQHWQHQHNRQHSSSCSDNTRPLHINGDRQLARNSWGARFFFCRVLWKWQFQISRTFFCPSVLPCPVWLVWPVTNKS